MQIEQINKNMYNINGLDNITLLKELFELFNINVKINNKNLVITTSKSINTFNEWQSKLVHPKIEYSNAEQIYKNLALISLYLEKNRLQLSHLNPADIIVINGTHFIPTNTEDLYTINNSNITVNRPYSRDNKYLSLELKNNNNIPFTVSFKCFYASVALLVYDLLIGLEEPDYQKGLLVIYMTKLYWMLHYSLLANIEDRLIVNI